MNDSTDLEVVEEIAASTGSAQADAAIQTRTEALLTELSQAGERRYRYNKRWRIIMKASAFYWFGFQCAHWLHLPLPADFRLVWRFLFYLYMLALVPVLIRMSGSELLFWALTKKRRTRFEMLMRDLSTDSRAVGAIAQFCTRTESMGSSDLAIKILVEMLPRVKAHDTRYISDSQMEALLALLDLRNQEGHSSARSEELPLAILKALERIGDSRAIEPVRRLTTGRRNRLYHQAAQRCLDVLEQQGEERDYNRSLLLPASLETGKETLLRPTVQNTETQPELLLRAVGDEERG
jgi:hypothetical protein